MRYPKVHWFEGMFLRPQHFQAADRYHAEQLTTAIRWQNAYAYGIHKITLQADALGAYAFQVNHLNLVTREGELIDVSSSPLRISLKEALTKGSSVTVVLAIPKYQSTRPNVMSASSPLGRYDVSALDIPDENTGVGDTEIRFKHEQIKLALSTDNLDGYDTLPLARIKRGAGDEALPALDDEYIPPLLSFSCWENLSQEIIGSLYNLYTQKMEVLAERALNHNRGLASSDPSVMEDMLLLGQVNHGTALLHALTFSDGVHPFIAYMELCRLVGMLSIFGSARRVPVDIPAYDHDNLGTVFIWLYRKLCELLGSAKKLEYEQRFFVGTEKGMQVTIDPKWLHPTWKWYVGVHGENIPVETTRELLRPGALNWKMGSERQVDLLFRHSLPDVKPEDDLRITPRALPSQQGWIYYEIRREGPAWGDVLTTETLAMRFSTTIIMNMNSLPNQRRLEVNYTNKRAMLEFALFAVPGANP